MTGESGGLAVLGALRWASPRWKHITASRSWRDGRVVLGAHSTLLAQSSFTRSRPAQGQSSPSFS